MNLTFGEFRIANLDRCEEVFHPLGAWTPADWGVALAGETGEACNAIKKLKRYDEGTNTEKDPKTKEDCIRLIGEELGDIVAYADLLATRLGLNLGEEVRKKFNKVSIRMDSSIKL